MSLFAKDWRVTMQGVAAAIDENLGAEPLIVQPMIRKPNNQSVEDPERDVFTTCGIFGWRAKVSLSSNGAPVESRDPKFSIRYEMLADRKLKLADRVTRECTGETFEITKVRDDGVSRVEVMVVQLGRHRVGGVESGGVYT
jgi:hypothetical protein